MSFRYVHVNQPYHCFTCEEIYFEDVKSSSFFNMIFEKMLRNKTNNESFKSLMIHLYNCLKETILTVKLIEHSSRATQMLLHYILKKKKLVLHALSSYQPIVIL